MTAEQLLKPRFQVISNYPESPFEIDEIIDGNILVTAPIGLNSPKYASDFPNIFKELKWHEYRTKEDFPEYVEVLETIPYYGINKGDVVTMELINKNIEDKMNGWSALIKGKALIKLDHVKPTNKKP